MLIITLLLAAGCGQSAEPALTDDYAQTGSAAGQQDTALGQQGAMNSGTATSEASGQQGENTLQDNAGGTAAAGEQLPGTESPDMGAISAQLPAEVTEFLINNAEKLAAEYQPDSPGLPEPIKITDTCSILDYAAGELDKDSYDDLAVIIEDSGNSDAETDSASRRLLVLSKRGQDKYGIVNYNPDFILAAEEGGVFGDPYSGVGIKNNTLSVVHYGGSNYRWGYVHEFAYEGGVLKLVRLTENDEFTGTGNGTKTVYDFRGSNLKQYAEYLDGSSEKLIYECTISKSDYMFNNFRSEDMNDVRFATRLLPDLDAYDYTNGTAVRTQTPPDKVLDTIKEIWFSDFNKVEFSWTEETRSNYASVCFFEPAGHYYEKGDKTLYYWKAEADDTGNVQHIVLLNSTDPAGVPTCNFYYYNDKTGEISIT